MVAVKLTKKRRVFSRHSSSVTFWPLESAFRKSDLYGAAYSAALRRARKKVAGLVGTQATLPGTMGLVGRREGMPVRSVLGRGLHYSWHWKGKEKAKGDVCSLLPPRGTAGRTPALGTDRPGFQFQLVALTSCEP